VRVLKAAAPILLSSLFTSKGSDLAKAAVDMLQKEPPAKGRTVKGY
jgi:hypothetical protein